MIRAAYIEQLNKPLKIDSNISMPKLERGQVLVKIAYSGVCHSQLMEARGYRGDDKFLPHMLGHEGSGVVLEIGKDVTKVSVGDKVILGWIKGDGIDADCPHYCQGEKRIHAGRVTTFMDHSIVSENRLIKLPKNVPMDIAVLFGCAIPTGAGIVMNSVKPEAGATVLVWGLGGIGLSALMALRLFDCKKVIAIDISDSKLELAKEFGATDIVNANNANVSQRVLELTGGVGVDYAIEAAGLTSTIEQAFSLVRKNGGKCIFASHPKFGEKINIDPFDLICGKRIEGSWGGSSIPDRDIPLLIELYLEGKLPLEKLISKKYKLDEVNTVLDDLENHKIARGILEIDPRLENL